MSQLDTQHAGSAVVPGRSKDPLTFDKLPAEIRLKIWAVTENMEVPPRWFSVAPLVDSKDNHPAALTVLNVNAGSRSNQRLQVPGFECFP